MNDLPLPAKKSLAQMFAELDQIRNEIMEAEGEISPEVESRMSVLDLSIPAKIDGCHFVIEGLTNSAEYLRAQAKHLLEAAMRLEKGRDFLKDRVKGIAIGQGIKELLGEDWRAVVSPLADKLEIIDESKIPLKYFKERFVQELDKKLLAEDYDANLLDETTVLWGVKKVKSSMLRWYANTKTERCKNVRPKRSKKQITGSESANDSLSENGESVAITESSREGFKDQFDNTCEAPEGSEF